METSTITEINHKCIHLFIIAATNTAIIPNYVLEITFDNFDKRYVNAYGPFIIIILTLTYLGFFPPFLWLSLFSSLRHFVFIHFFFSFFKITLCFELIISSIFSNQILSFFFSFFYLFEWTTYIHAQCQYHTHTHTHARTHRWVCMCVRVYVFPFW